MADAYSLRFFAELIDHFSETGRTLDEIEQACHDALTGKEIRFHKDAHSELRHEGKIKINHIIEMFYFSCSDKNYKLVYK